MYTLPLSQLAWKSLHLAITSAEENKLPLTGFYLLELLSRHNCHNNNVSQKKITMIMLKLIL